MTRSPKPKITLTYANVELIMYQMGWEPEDADVFWGMALRETRTPGCLHREWVEQSSRLFGAE